MPPPSKRGLQLAAARRERAEIASNSSSVEVATATTLLALVLAAGAASLPSSKEVEFNSSDDEWLNDLLVVDGEVDVELSWVDGAGAGLRAPHTGDSRATSFRHRKERRDEAAVSLANDKFAGRKQIKLDSFFKPLSALSAAAASIGDTHSQIAARRCPYDRDYDDAGSGVLTIDECIEELERSRSVSVSSNRKYNIDSNYDHLRYLMMYRYFLLRRGVGWAEPMGKMEASRTATLIASPVEKDYLSRCIRVWGDYFSLTKEIPVRRQGCHVKYASFIDYKDNYN